MSVARPTAVAPTDAPGPTNRLQDDAAAANGTMTPRCDASAVALTPTPVASALRATHAHRCAMSGRHPRAHAAVRVTPRQQTLAGEADALAQQSLRRVVASGATKRH
jgi:hypothetical protein